MQQKQGRRQVVMLDGATDSMAHRPNHSCHKTPLTTLPHPGVPQKVYVRPPMSICLAKPKSPSLA